MQVNKIRVKVAYDKDGSKILRADGDYSKRDYADLRYTIIDLAAYDIDMVIDKGKTPSQICKEHGAEVGGNCLFAWLDKYNVYQPIGNIVKDEKLIQQTANKWAEFILPKNGKPYIGQLTEPKGVKLSFTATPQIVKDGKIFVNTWAEGTPEDVKHNTRSKTGLGITKDGKIIFAVLDYSKYDGPMRIDEFALCLIYLGAWEAINLDGGGSSVFYADGKAQNYQARQGERRIGSALVFKKKAAGPTKATGKNVSAHFKDAEFMCHDGSGLVLIDPSLPPLLEKIRAHFNKPVIIVSGYRTPTYNAKVGGAKDSYHMRGMAADIKIPGIVPGKVASIAQRLGAGGVGHYATFTHVDVGPERYWDG